MKYLLSYDVENIPKGTLAHVSAGELSVNVENGGSAVIECDVDTADIFRRTDGFEVKRATESDEKAYKKKLASQSPGPVEVSQDVGATSPPVGGEGGES